MGGIQAIVSYGKPDLPVNATGERGGATDLVKLVSTFCKAPVVCCYGFIYQPTMSVLNCLLCKMFQCTLRETKL